MPTEADRIKDQVQTDRCRWTGRRDMAWTIFSYIVIDRQSSRKTQMETDHTTQQAVV